MQIIHLLVYKNKFNKVWDEITYSFLKFNGWPVEV